MNRIIPLLSLFLGVGIVGASAQSLLPSIQFNYASLPGQLINIDSASREITFDTNSNNEGFEVGIPNSFGLGGLRGMIEGTFTIGAVTIGPGPLETAGVSGSGTFKLFEPGLNPVALTSDLTWNNTLTYGALGVLNANASINMTNFAYAGTFAPLVALRDSSATGVSILTFQFVPGLSLTWLTTSGNGINSTSYSGSVQTNAPEVAIPEPTTYAAILAGAVLCGVVLRRRSASAARQMSL
jgi:hypothetical protein